MRTEKNDHRQDARRTQAEDDAFAHPPPPYAPPQSAVQAGPSARPLHAVATAGSDTPPPEVTVPWDTEIREGKVQVNCDEFSAPPLPAENSGPSLHVEAASSANCPPLNIVIFAVGARGDVQPYIALALQLIMSKEHRVRVATHGEFGELVTEASVRLAGLTDSKGRPLTGHLEHYNVGGEARQIMAYMVKHEGELPGTTLSGGDGSLISKRKMVRGMLMGCYRACFMPCETTGVPFAADTIISNPAAVGSIHIAEALGIPLSMSYIMPWTPTTAFPHPLVKVATAQSQEAQDNHASYVMADLLLYQGLGDVINDFRLVALGLPALDLARIPELVRALGIPWTYAWSEGLLPKPRDWREDIDVVGFYQIPPSTRAPRIPDELFEFLESGKPPVYIGDAATYQAETILAAVKESGVRAIVHADWLESGPDMSAVSKAICFVNGSIPHDWLFAEGRVSAVCHHGGAGTTAAGLKEGLPTIVIPFFGDQYFWADAVHAAGAGPRPIPYSGLTASKLAEAFRAAQTPEIRACAARLGRRLSVVNGTANGTESFQRHLPLDNMMCQVDPTQVARWWCQEFCVKVSNVAAAVIVESKFMSWRAFTPYRPIEYNTAGYLRDSDDSPGASSGSIGTQTVSARSHVYAPAKDFSNSLLDIPKASFDLLGQIQEGFDNVPAYLGADVRRRGQVNNLRSGMKEGAMGFAWGLADGLSGLVLEPVKGAKEGGIPGVITGTITGSINLAARVTGGALGIVTQPTAGLFRSARKQLARHGAVEARSVFCDAREHAAHAEAAALGADGRKEILAAWERLTGSFAIKQRMREERERLAALQAHFRAGGAHSGGGGPPPAAHPANHPGSSAGPDRRASGGSAGSRGSWGADPGGRASLGAAVAKMAGKGKARAEASQQRSSPYAEHSDARPIPGAYHAYTEEPERMPQARADSRVSLNSGADVALAGTGDRWYGSTSSLGGVSTLSPRSTDAASPVSPEVRGRRLWKAKSTNKDETGQGSGN